jgi:thioredoxin 1
MIRTTTDADFPNDVLQSDKLVLVDFWAKWCGPCIQLMPTVEAVAVEMKGTINAFKVNIDENPAMPTKYGVRSIPTLMLFNSGKLVATKVGGGLTKSMLIDWIKQHCSQS